MIRRLGIQITLPLAVAMFCLLEFTLNRESAIIREYVAVVLSLQWKLLACLAVWCCTFLFLTFDWNDWLLVGLLFVVIGAYFIGDKNGSAADALVLMSGATLGKGICFTLQSGKQNAEFRTPKSELRTFLVGLVLLLAFASLWHLDVSRIIYPGTRWTGLWNNPNDYGMLMGAGVVLAAGLVAERLKAKGEMLKSEKVKAEIKKQKSGVSGQQSVVGSQKPLRAIAAFKSSMRHPLSFIVFIAAGMMGIGLVMSYSRGAWVGAAVGMLFLGKVYGKFKWRWVLPPVLVAVAVAWFFWNTPRTAPWYLQRLDFSRGSVQHRVAAWKAGFEIMRDHPFGVGWNKTVGIYQQNYSPPEGGAPAITTNDYLMLGTQLGIPGLVCFVTYVALCFRRNRPHLSLTLSPPAGSGEGKVTSPGSCSAVVPTAGCGGVSPPAETPGGTPGEPAGETPALRAACRAGALTMLVAFWFDGGLFKLATTSVFWILLELGAERQKLKTEILKTENGRQLRHLTPALSPDKAEREPKSAIGNQKSGGREGLCGTSRSLRLCVCSSNPEIRVHLCPSVVKDL